MFANTPASIDIYIYVEYRAAWNTKDMYVPPHYRLVLKIADWKYNLNESSTLENLEIDEDDLYFIKKALQID